MKAQEEDQIRRKLEQVEQWRASGQSKADWAAANGITPEQLMGWITYASRWQARLAGEPLARRAAPQGTGFVQARIHSGGAGDNTCSYARPDTIRIDCPHSALVLHWPLTHSRELAELLGALRRA